MTEISPRIHVYLKKARNLGGGTVFGRHFFTRPTFRRINTQFVFAHLTVKERHHKRAKE